MEVEESSSEEDFRPVHGKKKRKKSSEATGAVVGEGKIENNLLNSNKFSALTGDKNNNNASPAGGGDAPTVPEPSKSAGKQKQPPLVVTNVGFYRYLNLMALCTVKPEYKLTRSGIKVTCYSVEDFNTVRELLLKYKVQFYTHDRRSERSHRVVLRGLPDVEVENVKNRLMKDHNLDVLDVKAIKRKGVSTADETPYIVFFCKGHTNLKKLSAVKKVVPVIVRWEAYRNKRPNVTQCSNCLRLGHGAKNCYLKARCNNCGQSHKTEKFKADESQAKRCANCSVSHEGLDRSCPKRAQFIQSRQQASKPKPSAWKKEKQSPVVQSFSPADFPPLPVPVSIPDKQKRTDPQSAVDAGSSQGSTGPGAGGQPKAKGDEVLYSTEELWKMFLGELWKMFYEFTARLKSCKTHSDQERVIGTMSRKFGAD